MRATHLTLLEKLLMYGYDYVNCYGLKHFLRPGFNSRSVYQYNEEENVLEWQIEKTA